MLSLLILSLICTSAAQSSEWVLLNPEGIWAKKEQDRLRGPSSERVDEYKRIYVKFFNPNNGNDITGTKIMYDCELEKSKNYAMLNEGKWEGVDGEWEGVNWKDWKLLQYACLNAAYCYDSCPAGDE